jgi:uncharacterized membrane protein
LARASGSPLSDTPNTDPLGMARWIAICLPLALIARCETYLSEAAIKPRDIAEIMLALAGYVALAQIVPAAWLTYALPWITGLIAIGTAWRLSNRRAGAVTLAVLTGLWALGPILDWLGASADAALGNPLFVLKLPALTEVAAQILPLTIVTSGLSLIAWNREGSLARVLGMVWPYAAGVSALVAAHILFKQIFALETMTRFVELGLAERTLWQALMLAAGAALLMSKMSENKAAITAGCTLVLLSLAHFAWFSFGLHNPLWDEQAVGPLPIANLALASYTVPLAGLFLLWKAGSDWLGMARKVIEPAAMGLIVFLALTLLRQVFAGSIMPPVPMSGTEDLLRSLIGIVLAVAFLIWGARTDSRSWRIGSLVLMLLAVGKVFLVDAAGLTGLLRIASFMALGFSLIGIGWLYSKHLSKRSEGEADGQLAGATAET